MDINAMLKTAVGRRASDLHVKVGSNPVIRVDGTLMPLSTEIRISSEDIKKVISTVMSAEQWETFKRKRDIDLAHSVPGLGRFRCNAFLQRGTFGIVFRAIPFKIPTLEELLLPEIISKISLEERGLVLVTGTTGSGKSTTLAAMVDLINSTKTANIITIEDPIEFLHRDKRGLINQREIGTDTESFGKALRAALRQDPDVIMVGEMRDFETIQTAMTAAETGHMVFSTLHTLDATETVGRIISVFPPFQHKQVRMQLSSVMKGIISLRLVPRADGNGRVPAVEVMLGTATIKDCILDPEKTKNIRDVIAQGKVHYSMQTFDQSLFDLFKKKLITYDEALKWATNVDDFKLRVKGIHSTSDMAGEEEDPEEGGLQEGMELERF